MRSWRLLSGECQSVYACDGVFSCGRRFQRLKIPQLSPWSPRDPQEELEKCKGGLGPGTKMDKKKRFGTMTQAEQTALKQLNIKEFSKMDQMRKEAAVKYWPSHLQVFIFLHKKSFSIVPELHMQVDRFSIYLNVHLKSVTKYHRLPTHRDNSRV